MIQIYINEGREGISGLEYATAQWTLGTGEGYAVYVYKKDPLSDFCGLVTLMLLWSIGKKYPMFQKLMERLGVWIGGR